MEERRAFTGLHACLHEQLEAEAKSTHSILCLKTKKPVSANPWEKEPVKPSGEPWARPQAMPWAVPQVEPWAGRSAAPCPSSERRSAQPWASRSAAR